MNTYSTQRMQRSFGRLGGLVMVLALVLQAGLTPAAGAITPGTPVPAGLTAQEWSAALQALPPSAQAYLKASNTAINSGFGAAVAVSGTTIAVSAPGEDGGTAGANSGAVYILVRTGPTWSQQAMLKASNPGENDFLGDALDLDGDTLVVGAPFEDSAATGVNGDQADNSAPESGAAYVFVRTGTTWTQQAYLKASNTEEDDTFGLDVAVSGNTVVVGAFFEDSAATGVNGDQQDNSALNSGAAYVFVRTGTPEAPVWSQQAYLKASNTDPAFADVFGFSVDISANTIVVGAFGEASAATGVNGDQTNNSADTSGAAYVFARTGTAWSQQAYLKASNTDALDHFGLAVAIDGETIVVAAPGEASAATGVNGDQTNNSASSSGAAYVFGRTGTTWSQQAYLKASNTDMGDFFGFALDLSGDTLVVGAPQEYSTATGVNGNQANNDAQDAGAAYVFARTGTSWSQQAYLKAFNTEEDDSFGDSVAVSGDTIVAGAPYEASAATGVNGNQQDNSAPSAGAAYVYGPAIHPLYVPLVLK